MSAHATCPAADLVVRRLQQWGVRQVFGYPGGQLTPIYDALARQSTIRHYLARHEQAAAFMADGFARATGQPGVCLAVCGPGLYNAATPLAAALTDSIPVLILSGQVPRAGAGLRSGYYHENEQLTAARSFTRAQFRLDSSTDLIAGLDAAWRALRDGRPGPVLVEIPVDVLREQVADSLPALPELPASLAPAPETVPAIAREVCSWQRPVFLVGGGAVDASLALGRLAMRLGAPVFHTANGKCALPASHPLHAGMPWHWATSDLSNMAEAFSPLWAQADGLLAVGCRFSQLATGSWTLPFRGRLVHIDLDAAEFGRHLQPDLTLQADARLALEALLEHCPAPDRAPWTTLPTRQQSWRLPGIEILAALRRAVPEETIFAVDVTRLAYILMTDFPLDQPRCFLHPAGAVAMGYGLPAGLGAKAAFPDRPVVVVVGDGGFQMSALELATAVQENLPVVIVLINDACLTLIRATQERRYEGRLIAVELRNPDFGLLARSFGVEYHLGEEDAQLEGFLRKAIKEGKSTLIEVRPA